MATPGRPGVVDDARQRVEEQAAAAGVELGAPEDDTLDLLVVLGGDGTMLRALRATLGTGTPVFGINFGRVGFLTTVDDDELDSALARALAGDVRVVDLCTLEARLNGETHAAVNDVVVTSSRPGRMVELGWAVGRREPRRPALRRDDLLHAVRLDRLQPLERRARADVGPRGDGDDVRRAALAARTGARRPPRPRRRITNRSKELAVTVLVDGHAVGELASGDEITAVVGADQSRLAVLPEVTFFTRYHEVFP